MRRIAKAGVVVRMRVRALSEFIDKLIVLTSEHVVIEAEPNRPVVGEGDCLLTRPLRNDRITRVEDREVALLFAVPGACANGIHLELRRIARVALHPLDGTI